MKLIITSIIAAIAFSSCAGLDGTTIEFQGGIIKVNPPATPIIIGDK